MASSQSLVIELELNANQFRLEIKDAERLLRQLRGTVDRTGSGIRRTQSHIHGLGRAFRDVTITAGLAKQAFHNLHLVSTNVAHSVVKASAEIERLTVLMRGLSKEQTIEGQMRDAQMRVDWLMKTAQRVPFAIKELAGGMAKFQSVGIDPLNGSFEALADAVARFGGDSQVFHRATVAIQQMAGKGIISMEELRQQLGEAVPDAIKMLARGMGLTMKQLVEQIGRGQVSAENLKKLFAEMALEIGGSSERLMETWGGQIQRLQTRWTLFLKEIGEADTGNGRSLFSLFKDELDKLSNYLSSEEGKMWAQIVGDTIVDITMAFKSMFQFIRDNWELVKTTLQFAGIVVGINMAAAAIASLGAAFTAIYAPLKLVMTLMGGPKALVIWGAVAAAGYVWSEMDPGSFERSMEKLSSSMSTFLTKITGDLGDVSGRFEDFIYDVDDVTERIFGSKGEFAGAGDKSFLERFVVNADKNIPRLKQRLEELKVELAEARKNLGPEPRPGQQDNALVMEEYKRGLALIANLETESRQTFADLIRLQGQLHAAQAALHQMETAGIRADARDYAQIRLKGLIDEAQAFQNEINNRKMLYEQELETAQQTIQDPRLRAEKQGEIRLAFHEKALDLQAERVFLFEQEIDFALNEMAVAKKGSAEYERWAQVAKVLNEELLKMRQQLQMGSALNDPNLMMTGDDKAVALADQKFTTRMNMYQSRVADLMAEINGVGADKEGFLAKLNAEFGTKDGIWKFLTDPEKARQLRDAAKALDIASFSVKQFRENSKLDDEIESRYTSLLSKQASEMERVSEEYDELTGKVNIYSASMRALMNERERVESDLMAFGPVNPNDPRLKRLDEMMGKQWKSDSQKLVSDLTKSTAELTRVTMTSKDAAKAAYQFEVMSMSKRVEEYLAMTENKKEIELAWEAWLKARTEALERDMETPLQRQAREWEDMTDKVNGVWADAMQDMTDRFMEFIKTGKFEFTDFVSHILEQLVRIQIEKAVMAPLSKALDMGIQAIGAWMGGGTGGMDTAGWKNVFDTSAMGSFALGGVMSSKGAVALRRYASGGIATSPQLALFGEGSTPEAFVPLPDGRAIPVKMEGQTPPPVIVNVINQSGVPVNAEQGGQRFDAGKMVLDVVLQAASRPGPFRDGLRGAVR